METVVSKVRSMSGRRTKVSEFETKLQHTQKCPFIIDMISHARSKICESTTATLVVGIMHSLLREEILFALKFFL